MFGSLYFFQLEWYTGPGHVVPSEDARDDSAEHLVQLWQAYMNPHCVAGTDPGQAHRCILPHFLYRHLTVPLFIAESITDVVIMVGFEGVPADLNVVLDPLTVYFIEEYARNATANFRQLNSTRDGIFAPSCPMHCGFTLDGPLIGGLNLHRALASWVNATVQGVAHLPYATKSRDSPASLASGDARFTWVDECPLGVYWPWCNPTCPWPICPNCE
jgi:hypothetical protein